MAWKKKVSGNSDGSTVTDSINNGNIIVDGQEVKIYDDANIVNVLNDKADVNHSHTLTQIEDIDATGKADGYILQYDSTTQKTKFQPLPSGTGSGATNLNGLTDVDVTTTVPKNGDSLGFEDGIWKPTNITNGGAKAPQVPGTLMLKPHPLAKNPVLTKDSVTDVTAGFVADPFIVFENGIFYMFFEILLGASYGATTSGKGIIGYATSPDGIEWTYKKILDMSVDGVHWSYPQVFKDENGDWWMIPQRTTQGLTLWKATSFPEVWVKDADLFTIGTHDDATIFQWKGLYYIFDYTGSAVNLWYSSTLQSTNWTPHPMNPIFTSAAHGSHTRGGGRVIVYDDCMDWVIQGTDSGYYGETLKQCRVSKLTTTEFEYAFNDRPLLKNVGNNNWNALGMHQVDVMWTDNGTMPIVVVDAAAWTIGIYTLANKTQEYYSGYLASNIVSNTASSGIPFTSKGYYTGYSFNYTNSTFTAPVNGLYRVNVRLTFETPPPAGAYFNIQIGGKAEKTFIVPSGIGTTYPYSIENSVSLYLKNNEAVVLKLFNAGGTATITSSKTRTFFTIELLDEM